MIDKIKAEIKRLMRYRDSRLVDGSYFDFEKLLSFIESLEKEQTDIDFEKEYKEALERAKAGKPLDEVFPELAESEDERIRKELIDHCIQGSKQRTIVSHKEDYKRWLAYLEKQKEQKPNIELIQKSWYLEGYYDGKNNIEPKWLIQTCEGGPRYEENPKYGTQKPAEWSEEDDAKWYGVIETEEYMLRVVRGEQRFDVGNKEIERQCEEELDWLKSLRPQPHWKPSEEQMSILAKVFAGCELKTPERDSMVDLFYNLKRMI